MFWFGCIVGSIITCIGYFIIELRKNRKTKKEEKGKKENE